MSERKFSPIEGVDYKKGDEVGKARVEKKIAAANELESFNSFSMDVDNFCAKVESFLSEKDDKLKELKYNEVHNVLNSLKLEDRFSEIDERHDEEQVTVLYTRFLKAKGEIDEFEGENRLAA